MRELFFGFEGRIGRGVFWAVQIPVLVLFWFYGQHVDPLLARWFPYSVFEGLTFALVLAVEVALILRALFYLARDKAQAAEPAEE